MAGAVLIAAQAGRALAQAARRAGLRAYVADLFGDADTLELADGHRLLPGRLGTRVGAEAVVSALDALAAQAGGAAGLVLGSGFENAPALIARLAARHRLLGADAATVAAVKDPFRFAALCARLGVPHPAVRRGPVPDPGGCLVKQAGGSGGGHVRPASSRPASSAPESSAPPSARPTSVRQGRYLQARVPGRAHALNFLADGRSIRVLALTEQWCAPSPTRPFRYGGALSPAPSDPAVLPRETVAAVVRAAERITAATGLRGLASADFLAGPEGWWLLEINPRPGATLDVLDRRAVPLLAAHIAACGGTMPEVGAPPPDAAAAQICYALRRHAAIPAFNWPDHVRDRPRPGSAIPRGAPLCTVVATGAGGPAALETLSARTAGLRGLLADACERR